MNILILHGPNLNLLGEREPSIYGAATLKEINDELERRANEQGASLRIYQTNHEGLLIDRIHEHRHWNNALIINPGAFTHYSYALRDAIEAHNRPTVEVHLSDITKREDFRKYSVLEGLNNVRRIFGKGAAGYYEALELLIRQS